MTYKLHLFNNLITSTLVYYFARAYYNFEPDAAYNDEYLKTPGVTLHKLSTQGH